MTKALGYDDRDALYGSLREHHLRVGDSQFYVPPTAISVSRRMKNHKINVLRGRGSFVKGSGYSDQIIEMTLFFPDMISINNELRPLLAQIRKCPFLPIENTLLNDIYKIDAITVSGVSVRTIDGFPHSLEAQIQFYAFNPFTYISDDTERTFDEMFNWPLFRWHYQQNLKPNPSRNLIYYEPMQMEMHNDFIFRMASEDDLDFIRKWRKNRNKFIQDYQRDMKNNAAFSDDDYTWIGPIPIPKAQSESVTYDADGMPTWSGVFDDEKDEASFNDAIDSMYRSNPGKVISEMDIHMENWGIPGLFLQEVSVGYENIISPLQVQAHESPTHQYLGSQDSIFIAKFIAEDQEVLGSLQSMIQRTTYLTREYHKEVSNGFIQFDHQLTRLFGANYMVIEDMQSSNIQGQPGAYTITLTMTSYNRAQKRLSETKWLSENIDWDIGWADKAWWNLLDKPWLREDPNGSFMSLDVRKKAAYDQQVKAMLKNVEVYPDLELPTYDEVEAAGFKINNINDGIYVDPDFFLIYTDPIDYGEQMGQFMDSGGITAEARDYMGEKAEINAGKITAGKETGESIQKQKDALSTNSAFTDAPDSTDKGNLPVGDMEIILRKKASEQKVDQRLVVAMAKAFDPQLRQFYTVGEAKNKDIGDVKVTEANVPIMMNQEMKYFTDIKVLRQASYIGLMRVSPVNGEFNALGKNIEYNVEQGCVALKLCIDKASATSRNDNFMKAMGITNGTWASWAAGIICYLGFEREYNLLLKNNKKMPTVITSLVKKIIKSTFALQVDKSIDARYESLPIADYKKVSANSAEPTFKDENMTEEDFFDHEKTLKGMYHDMVKYDKRGRLVRAFPTFFLLLIDEGQYMGSVKMSDQFFGYRAVTDITYTNSRKLASSTLTLEMANVFGNLSDAIKANDLTHTSTGDLLQSIFLPGSMADEVERSRHRDSAWYKSMYLRTGARVHFRMGYGSNPMNMPTMMNGTITQLENSGETVTVVCQDDGTELTNKLKAKPDEQTRGFLFSTKEITEVVDELLTDNQGALTNWYANRLSNSAYAEHSLGIMHFGMPGKPINYFWKTEFSERPQNEITMNIYETTGLMKEESNGFWNKLGDFFGIGQSDEEGININLYDKTIWDILSISASIGEDYITAVHPFDFRNTIFLGKPYFPLGYEYEMIGETKDDTAWYKLSNLAAFQSNFKENAPEYTGLDIKRKPFRQINIYDSWTSIIDNGIIATDENMYTVAQGVYYDEGKMDTTDFIYVDTNIWPEKQRTVQIDTQLNLQGVRLVENIPLVGHWLNKPFKWYFDEYTAIKMAASGLRDLVKEMYDGYLTVIGDPSAKPHNQVYLYDTYTDMSGPIEIREVTHIMNFEVGYITMIKPDCCVVNSDKTMTNYWASAGALAARAFTVAMVRQMLRNEKYTGTLPIMNALWASVKTKYSAMMGKWDSSKMKGALNSVLSSDGKTQIYRGGSGPIFEVDPITGQVREYNPVSVETKARWKKNGLLQGLFSKIEGFTLKDGSNLFNKLDSALANRKYLGYDKIDMTKLAKLKGSASEALFKSAKTIGKTARYGRKGIQAAIGVGAAFLGPVGWVGYAIEFAVTEIVCAGIAEYIERFLFTRQACILAPLRKDKIEFSAGINGHQGSVIGDSPDMWNQILTGTVGSIVLGFLGADTSKYAVDGSSVDDLYGMSAMAENSAVPTLSMDNFAKNFFEAHRKQVYYDQGLVDRYDADKKEAAKIMQGHLEDKDKESSRKPLYKEEESDLLTAQSLKDMFGGGSAYNADGTSFDSVDLNKPSGISADAINEAFKNSGKLAGLGETFVNLESSIPRAPSPLGIIIESPNEGGRVMNALYLAAHAAWETGWGDSRIFKDKNNAFGYGAYDSSPYESAYTFASASDCINYAANKIKDSYLTQGGKYYNGPTLQGMNVEYAQDKAWAEGIASIMLKISKLDPNFIPPSVANGATTTGEKPVIFGAEGKAKYHLATEKDATKVCINLKDQPLTNVKLTLVTPSVYIRKASYDLVEALGKAYKAKTGQTIAITSAYRQGDTNWHGTGFGVDIDTPNCGFIGGKRRFAYGSKDKINLKILMQLAVDVGFGGIIHGDVDVCAEVKAANPKVLVAQRNDHYNHLHLSFPRL